MDNLELFTLDKVPERWIAEPHHRPEAMPKKRGRPPGPTPRQRAAANPASDPQTLAFACPWCHRPPPTVFPMRRRCPYCDGRTGKPGMNYGWLPPRDRGDTDGWSEQGYTDWLRWIETGDGDTPPARH
jgi:hypothetical protein